MVEFEEQIASKKMKLCKWNIQYMEQKSVLSLTISQGENPLKKCQAFANA